MQDQTVLIVGAGPTGLVLALWLTRLGISVRIIDRLEKPGTTSRALAVQARTLELYDQIGIADDVMNAGVRVLGINLWVGGTKRARVPLGELGKGLSPYSFPLVYPQDAHEKLLIQKLGELGVNVERETTLISLSQDGTGVAARLKKKSGEEETVNVAYLAGCDGASSTVRHQLGIGLPGGTYEGLFYVADVNAEGSVADNELHIDLEDADFLLIFPLEGKGNLRLVGYAADDTHADGATVDLHDVKSHAVEHMKLENIKMNWFSTYHVHHRVADAFRKDRVFILGDAAHVHSPVGGQGMNTGIGDAVNLAWKLAAVLKREASPAILDSYEPERIAFARRLVATTDRAFTVVTSRTPRAQFLRTRVVPLILPYATRFGFLRRFGFRTVSQINVSYLDSPLSAGTAGAVRAGQRLPWIDFGKSTNFDPLKSLKWQVHIYGSANSDITVACEDLHLEIHVFPWSSGARKAGFAKGAMYLVRPDGYVALADAGASAAKLRSYMGSREISLRRPA